MNHCYGSSKAEWQLDSQSQQKVEALLDALREPNPEVGWEGIPTLPRYELVAALQILFLDYKPYKKADNCPYKGEMMFADYASQMISNTSLILNK